jgi:hypothetical protein
MVASGPILRATTMVPLSLGDVVKQAPLAFVGEVVDVRSEWDSQGPTPSIVTIVTFDVASVLKGTVGLRTELTFLGGTVGDVTLKVSDMPIFQKGDRDVLFVSGRARSASPLVGFSQGRYRVLRDPLTHRDYVQGTEGLLSTGLNAPLSPAPGLSRPASLNEFLSLVRAAVAAGERR